MDHGAFFDGLAERWDGMEREDMGERLARVVAESGLRPGHCVLDVGTGTGVLIPHLLAAMEGRGRVLAIDISAGMIGVAERKGFPPDVEFRQLDAQASGLPDGSCDRVFCNAVFPHFADKPVALAEVYRLLRPGGMLVISHPVGREAVNRLHAETGGAVADDLIPPAEEMAALLTAAGFQEVTVIDEPGFHLARGVRPCR